VLGLSELVIEAMKIAGYAVRDGLLAWWRWHREEPCDAWVYHAAMYALTPKRRKGGKLLESWSHRWHARVGRRSLARCVAKKIRDGQVPPKIDGNPARWLEVHHQKAANRIIAECDRVLRTCRDESPEAPLALVVHRAVERMRQRSPAPRFVDRDDTPPVDDSGVPT
jgi:hypothetical protein